jgi:putative membrane protein
MAIICGLLAPVCVTKAIAEPNAPPGSSSPAPFDRMFLNFEAQASAYELALAQLGEKRATRQDVREYAERIEHDHSAYNDALAKLAQLKGIPLDTSLRPADRARLKYLSAQSGVTFDNAFIAEARRVNGDDLRNFRREATRTSDPDIRDFVRRFLGIDEEHEHAADALSRSTSRMPVIKPPETGSRTPVLQPPESGSRMPVIKPGQQSDPNR